MIIAIYSFEKEDTSPRRDAFAKIFRSLVVKSFRASDDHLGRDIALYECNYASLVHLVGILESSGSVTMWRLVCALTLLGAALVTALPAAQQQASGSAVEDLIDDAFPELKTSTTPQTVPQIGGDVIGDFIKEVFGNVTTTTTSSGLILGSQNQKDPKPADCECVPYYQCKDGKILETGVGIIDIRSGFGSNNSQAQG